LYVRQRIDHSEPLAVVFAVLSWTTFAPCSRVVDFTAIRIVRNFARLHIYSTTDVGNPCAQIPAGRQPVFETKKRYSRDIRAIFDGHTEATVQRLLTVKCIRDRYAHKSEFNRSHDEISYQQASCRRIICRLFGRLRWHRPAGKRRSVDGPSAGRTRRLM